MTTTPAPHARSNRAISYAWVALSAITVVSWWLSPAHPGEAAVASVPITVAVVVLGVIKGRLIIGYFMEVRTAPRWLRYSTDAWLLGLWTSVLAIYLW